MGKVVTELNRPNNTQNFYPNTEEWVLKDYPFAASVALEDGTAVGIEISGNTTTGNLTKMGLENALGADFVGILAEEIATDDVDYATAGKLKQVWVPKKLNSQAYFKVIGGTFTAVDVFKTVEFDATAKGLAVDTAGKGARIVGYIDSSNGICTFDMPKTETA